MTVSMYAMSVELFISMLVNLGKILDKAAAFIQTKKLEAGVIERARLAPDMLSLVRQVQLSCDFAKNSAARLAGVDAPKFEDNEETLDDLKARVAMTIDYLRTLTPAQFTGSESRHIVVPLRTRTLELDGLPFLQKWALPNFYFHVTTTYNILRHNGLDLGKQDYLGGV
jgi:hypothetical protein